MGIGRGNDDGSAASFVRGLTIGALLGAAIAGSSLWSRRRRANRNRQAAVSPEAAALDDATTASTMADPTTAQPPAER
jgi:hypothetical protein